MTVTKNSCRISYLVVVLLDDSRQKSVFQVGPQIDLLVDPPKNKGHLTKENMDVVHHHHRHSHYLAMGAFQTLNSS